MTMTRTLGDITGELREKILAPAKEEAERIIGEARAQADRIVLEARREAEEKGKKNLGEIEDTRRKMDMEMKSAAQNFLLLLEERLERAIIRPVVEEALNPVLDDPYFLREVLETLIREFFGSQGSQASIDIILPERQKIAMENFFLEKFKEKAGKGVRVHFTDKVTFGFRIGVGETGRHFNFEDGLPEAFVEFCSPRFRKYFFDMS